MGMRKGFTLIEILIVVAILGILTAIIVPEFQGHVIQAKESSAREILQMLRGQTEVYAIQHNGIPPGYLNGNMSEKPVAESMILQLTSSTNINGQWAQPKTIGYDYGPYMSVMPINPFNGSKNIHVVDTMPEDLAGDINNAPQDIEPAVEGVTYGWLYHGPTKTIRLNTSGRDNAGMAYQNY